jgi:hypothetical protein
MRSGSDYVSKYGEGFTAAQIRKADARMVEITAPPQAAPQTPD